LPTGISQRKFRQASRFRMSEHISRTLRFANLRHAKFVLPPPAEKRHPPLPREYVV
jgi:hypothetical protein